jgi:hypothetical protein
MDDFIQLKKDNILKIGIKDANGIDTNEHLEFDLEDIELPIKYNQSVYEHNKNLEYLKTQYIIIDKKQRKKGKGILSSNDREKINVLKEFYKREMHALDLFLGEGGTKKLLNGRNPYYSMYNEFSEILNPIMPLLDVKMEDIENKIKQKYSDEREENSLE